MRNDLSGEAGSVPSVLEGLYEAERAAPSPDAAAIERVLGRLEASVGALDGGGSGGSGEGTGGSGEGTGGSGEGTGGSGEGTGGSGEGTGGSGEGTGGSGELTGAAGTTLAESIAAVKGPLVAAFVTGAVLGGGSVGLVTAMSERGLDESRPVEAPLSEVPGEIDERAMPLEIARATPAETYEPVLAGPRPRAGSSESGAQRFESARAVPSANPPSTARLIDEQEPDTRLPGVRAPRRTAGEPGPEGRPLVGEQDPKELIPAELERDGSDTDARSSGDGFGDERVLLWAARTALARGSPEQALRYVTEHEERHFDNALAEEREALRVLALAAMGRRDEAARSLEAFRVLYPESLFLDSLEQGLEEK